ncbi:MAG: MFS transporter [Alicyclobacillus sp.]|nr:MFS transporter [Alicyclobacillus sp.]
MGSQRRFTAVAMFSVLLLAYVVNAMDRQLFPVLATDVRQALHLSLPQVGLASTIFTLGIGVAGIPTGYLLAKTSRKNVALLGLFVFSAATLLTAFAQGLPDLLLYRFVSGMGEAMQLTALLAIGTTYFRHHRAVAASSLNFTFGIGAIIGPNLGAWILSRSNWHAPFVMFGLIGGVVLVISMVGVRTWLTEVQADPVVTADSPDAHLASSIWARTPAVLALATVFAGLAIYGYLGLYPTYLREALGFSPGAAGLAVSFYGFGALLSLVGGWLGDRWRYTRLLMLSLVLSAISGALLFSGLHQSLALHILFSFIFGGAVSGMVYANLSAGIIKSVRREKASQASGLFVSSLYIPAAFAGYLLGMFKQFMGWTGAGMLMLSGCSLIAAVLCAVSGAGTPPAAARTSAPSSLT